MAMLKIVCPKCQAEGEIPPGMYARKIKCSKCGTSFTPADEEYQRKADTTTNTDPSIDIPHTTSSPASEQAKYPYPDHAVETGLPVDVEKKPHTFHCLRCYMELPMNAVGCPNCDRVKIVSDNTTFSPEPEFGTSSDKQYFCIQCRLQLPPSASFCSACGTPTGRTVSPLVSTTKSVEASNQPVIIPSTSNPNNISQPQRPPDSQQMRANQATHGSGDRWARAFTKSKDIGENFSNAFMPLFRAANNMTTASAGCMGCCTFGCLGAFMIPIVHYSLKMVEWFTYYTLLLSYWMVFGIWYMLYCGFTEP